MFQKFFDFFLRHLNSAVASKNRFQIYSDIMIFYLRQMEGYTQEEKFEIAIKCLKPKQFRMNGITYLIEQEDSKYEVVVDDDVIRSIIKNYTREAGVRRLEHRLAQLSRYIVLKVSVTSCLPLLFIRL